MNSTYNLSRQNLMFSSVLAAGLLCASLFFAPSLLFAQQDAMLLTSQETTPASVTSITRSESTPGAIDVKGRAQPRRTINIEIVSDSDGPLDRAQTTSNEAGDWQLTIGDSSFPEGAYTLRAIVQDVNGVLGPVTEVRGYKVQPKPLFEMNGYRFGWLDAFLGSLFSIFILVAVGSWYYERRRRLHEERLLIAERDIQSMSHNLMEEVDRLDHLIRDSKGLDPHVAAEAEYLLRNQQNKLYQMQHYIAPDAPRS